MTPTHEYRVMFGEIDGSAFAWTETTDAAEADRVARWLTVEYPGHEITVERREVSTWCVIEGEVVR